MEWKNFITPIRKSEIISDISPKILLNLFEQAGSKCDVSETTAKSWLNGNRNCKVSTYFPRGSVDTKSLFRYFRNRPDGKLQQLQQIFRDEGHLDSDSPVDVQTNNLDVFCWSLVNQFLDLLRFQRIDIPKDVAANQEQAIEDQSDSASSLELARADILNDRKRSSRSMILPHRGDCCYHCDYWDGDRETFGAYTTPTYGRCIKYNREGQMSSGLACKDYKKRPKLIGDW